MPSFEMLRRESDIRSFKQGDVIFNEGDAANFMFAVVEGEVEIRVGGAVVERCTPITVFGEMALIDGKPRSATAVAAVDCRLAAIDEKRFLRLVEQVPRFALQIMRVISERLRRSTAR